jgi:hypothetical protein
MIMLSHSRVDLLFENTGKFKAGTVHPDLLCKASEGFSRGMFKPNADFVRFLLSEYSEFQFGSVF